MLGAAARVTLELRVGVAQVSTVRVHVAAAVALALQPLAAHAVSSHRTGHAAHTTWLHVLQKTTILQHWKRRVRHLAEKTKRAGVHVHPRVQVAHGHVHLQDAHKRLLETHARALAVPARHAHRVLARETHLQRCHGAGVLRTGVDLVAADLESVLRVLRERARLRQAHQLVAAEQVVDRLAHVHRMRDVQALGHVPLGTQALRR